MVIESNQSVMRKTLAVVRAALSAPPWYVWVAAILLASHLLTPYDDTDNAAVGERSGMGLYTDNLTGCQYLKAGVFGGITPRLDGKGGHIGCR